MTRTAHILKALFDRDERYRLQSFEGSLPVPVQRCALRALGDRANPYHSAAAIPGALFIHVPKTGGTSIATALGISGGGHIPLSRYYAVDPQGLARLFSFAVVRNPWDRLLSAFTYLSNPNRDFQFRDFRWAAKYLSQYQDFEQFVLALRERRVREAVLDYIHFLPQVHWLTVPGHPQVRPDFVGRYEALGEAFEVISDRLTVKAALPVTRKSGHAPYLDRYSDKMIAIVGDLYAADAVTFGYQFNQASAQDGAHA